MIDRGVETVLATLGGAGAVLVTRDGAWHATAPPTEVVSTVGAGDSSLFGYLLGDLRGQDPAHRLALAVAYGRAAAGLPGTTIPQPSQVRPDLVAVRELRPLMHQPAHGLIHRPIRLEDSDPVTDLIIADLVRLDADLGADKHDVIRGLTDVVSPAGRATDVEQLLAHVLAREAKSATGVLVAAAAVIALKSTARTPVVVPAA